jgi:hypothetical protein
MAHFAELDEHNTVIRVIVGVDYPYDGEAIYKQETGRVWKRTSYNTYGGVHQLGGTPFRKNYAGIGFTYDQDRDAFYAPQPYPSWTLDEATCIWQPPVACPTDETRYQWDESIGNWMAYDF